MDANEASGRVRLFTWISLACAVIGAALAILASTIQFGYSFIPALLGLAAVILALRARSIGSKNVKGYDGRLSLLAAMIGLGIFLWHGPIALVEYVVLTNS